MVEWLLAFGMLLGRLEFFTVLVILNPTFWRR
jgi:trk system potassium uptake protein TrkH